jgi:cell division protein ZapA (FtsZ GTPase activity inhibitor)
VKACEVKIFGHSYSLRAQVNEDLVYKVAEIVDSRMRDVAAASPSASALQVAVLAALDIASERCAAEAYADLPRVVSDKADAMIRLIDEVAPETQLA